MDYISELYKKMIKDYDESIINDITELLETKYGFIVNKNLLTDIFKDYAKIVDENNLKETYTKGDRYKYYKKQFLDELFNLTIHKQMEKPNDLVFIDALYEAFNEMNKEINND